MGRRGPKPTPTAILHARGSWRAKTRHGEPQPPRLRPVCPARLSPAAKRIWRQLIPQLDAMGVLTRIDSNALELYCDTFARWLDAVASLQKHSSVMAIRDKAGTIIGYADRPEVARADRLLSQIQRLGSRFGLTPADRVALCGAANKPAQRASGQGKVTYLNLGERTG